MPHPTGPTNPSALKLATELRKTKNKAYAEIVKSLERPRRSKAAVNISRLSRLAGRESTFIVCGKVLGIGEIKKPITVYAMSFSSSAREKITKSGGRALTLKDMIKDKTEGRLVT